MKKISTVLILAGGDSDRFWPLTNKNYFQFSGEYALERQIKFYSNVAETIVIVENKNNQDIIAELIKKVKKTISCEIILVFQQKSLSGQAGAILSARNLLHDDVLIVNANDFYHQEILEKMIAQINEKKPDLFFLAKKVNKYFPGGYFQLKKSKVKAIIEKPDKDNLPSDMVKLVVDYVKNSQKLINFLQNIKTETDNQYELGLNEYLAQSNNVQYLINDGDWFTLKYPWQILALNQYFLKQQKELIVLGKNVKISSTAKIVGPCFIDDNTVIGDFSLVVNSHIGKNCLIGGYCEVTRSYFGDNVKLHRNYIGDSVLGNNVLMGAGAVTANYRFDELTIQSMVKNNKVDTQMLKMGVIIGTDTKIGVNSTLFPGVKIGSKSLIAPASIVNQDIEDKIYFCQGNKIINQLL